jgi:DNA-directed RNA polymerase subunit RPC12/RpoP
VDDPADADRAKAIIEKFKTTRSSGPPVKCPHCGEENPGTFDLCWNCGRDVTSAK